MRLGLVAGENVVSFSPLFFRRIYSLVYEKTTPTSSPEQLRAQIAERRWIGFNVTTPYKSTIYDLLDVRDPVVEAIRAVNTVAITPEGQWHGYNTDFEAAYYLLGELQHVYPEWEAVLLLGTGGAARAVAWAHWQLLPEIPIYFVSRTPERAPLPFAAPHNALSYSQAIDQPWPARTLLVQATPIGMFPRIQALPDFPPDRIQPTWVVWELIYNPNPTLFAQRARQQGASIETGMLFFRKQAERSLAIWERMWVERYRPRIRSAS